jgi:hypothetical protein
MPSFHRFHPSFSNRVVPRQTWTSTGDVHLHASSDAIRCEGRCEREPWAARSLRKWYEEARIRLVEARVHRWAGAVCGQPGGDPIRDARHAHQPDAVRDAGVFVVGDYLFDSNLNGVVRSADVATDLLLAWTTTPARVRPRSCQRVGC